MRLAIHKLARIYRRARTPQKFALFGLLLICLARPIGLLHTPTGFFVDEAIGSATIIELRQSGRDLSGEWMPLYAKAGNGGYVTPLYMYSGVVWSTIFGDSEYAFRLYSVLLTTLAVLLLALAMYLWLGGTAGIITAYVSLLLPWSWHQGNLAWDPAMVPLWVAAGLLAWSYVMTRHWSKRVWLALLLSVIALVYTYPPSRIAAVLISLYYVVTIWRKHKVSHRYMVVSSVTAFPLLTPLLLFMLTPEARMRSDMLSVWSWGAKYYANVHSLQDSLTLTAQNMRKFLSLDFMFFKGDPSLRHSTGKGLLGVSSLAICIGYFVSLLVSFFGVKKTLSYRKLSPLVGLLCTGTFGGLLASALTWESQPHSLRAVTAWPFVALLLAIACVQTLRYSKVLFAGTVAISLLLTCRYMVDYYTKYNQRSQLWYDTSLRVELIAAAKEHRSPVYKYEPFGFRYYQLRYYKR
jgi:4-amino-4-deoxy-L-arabinose transferase-like glycosyltransferase